LIASANLKHSKKFLGAIKDNIEFNEKFLARFGKLKDSAHWTQDSINIKGHNPGDKEASITVASIGTDMTSQHYDLILMDDIINREFAATADQRQKCVEFYLDCTDLLEPEGRTVLVGTRWHFDDIYSGLILEHRKSPFFKVVIDEPTMFNPKYSRREFKLMMDDPDTTFLFPEKFNLHVVKNTYRKKLSKPNGGYEFSCQQMNFPVSDDRAPFKLSEFKFVEVMPTSCTTYLTIDPAGADKISKGQDDAAIVTTGIDVTLDLYNQAVFSDKVTSSGLFTAINDMALRFPNSRKIGMEKNFNNNNALYISEKYPAIAAKLVTYTAANTTDRKAQAILALQPYVSNGKFYFVTDKNGMEYNLDDKVVKLSAGQHKLLMQLLDYGSAPHDDAADAQAAVLQFIRKPRPVQKMVVSEYRPVNRRTGY